MELIAAIAGAGILYLIQNYLYHKYWFRRLSVELTFSKQYAMEGDNLALKETITNHKPLPLPILMLKFKTSRNLYFIDDDHANITDQYYRNDMLSVLMYQKLTRTLSFQCRQRGYYTINQVDVIGTDLFFSTKSILRLNIHTDLYVYPKQLEHDILEATYHKMLGTVLTKRFINEDPFEFCNIREYQTHDSLKSVNWKATAKTGAFMVNVHDHTSSQQVRIILNTEAHMIGKSNNLLEEGIQVAATLSLKFISQGIPTALITNAKDIETSETVKIASGSGDIQITKLQEAMARIDLSKGPVEFLPVLSEELKNADSEDYIIIISTYHKEELQRLLLSQLQTKIEFVWIIPENQDIQAEVDPDLEARIILLEFE